MKIEIELTDIQLEHLKQINKDEGFLSFQDLIQWVIDAFIKDENVGKEHK